MNKYSEKDLLRIKTYCESIDFGAAYESAHYVKKIPGFVNEILSLRHEIEMAQKLMKCAGFDAAIKNAK